MRKQYFLALSLVLGLLSCTNKTITIATLLEEMVDTKAITYFPEQTYTTKQFSSYDRASDKNDKNDQSWFSNHDYSNFLGVEQNSGRREFVLYDAKGPGVMTRYWMTVVGAELRKAVLRFYIDGDTIPALEGYALDVIGRNKTIGYPLSSSVSEKSDSTLRSYNLYMPIPYAKSCKITLESDALNEQGKGHSYYYNINYRTYTSEAKLESFSRETLEEYAKEIAQANATLSSSELIAPSVSDNISWGKTLASKQSESLKIQGEGSALSTLSVRLKAEDMESALRTTVMKIRFDGQQTVWVPVGDFFSTGHIYRQSKTMRQSVDESSKTLSSNWIMPFKGNCEIEFENLARESVEVDVQLSQCDYRWSDRSMYFGASWHQYSSVSTGEGWRGMEGQGEGLRDINYVDLKGKGVYVGDVLSIYNTAPEGRYAWWGEGDEKIYVDGENFPSHFGTGTEDYYGYSWCRPETYVHPIYSQPIGDGNLAPGYTINTRFRTLDAIPFEKSLDFDMEMWHWTGGAIINYAPTCYYYMLPGGTSNYEQGDISGALHPIARSAEDVVNNQTK